MALRNGLALGSFCVSRAHLPYALSLQYKIEGLDGALLKNSELRLQVKQAAYGTPLAVQEATRLIEEGVSEIQKAIEPFGYFNATIAMTVKKDEKKKQWVATYMVKRGPLLPVRHLSTSLVGEGKSNRAILAVIERFKLKPQRPFTTAAYNHDLEAFDNKSNVLGYIKANTRGTTVSIHRQENWADVAMHLDTGPRYYFGPVTFNDETYNLNFLRRFIPFKVGEPFSLDVIGTFRRDLLAADLFESVNIDKLPPTPNKPNFIPLNVSLIPDKPYNYYTGLGVGSDDGLRALLGLRIRRIHDRGQHIDLSVRATRSLIDAAASYTIPGFKPVTDYYMLETHLQSKKRQEIGHSRLMNVGIKSVKELGQWHQELGIFGLREHSYPDDESDYLSVLVYPKASYSRIWKFTQFTQSIRPIETMFSVLGSSASFLSDISLVQARGEWRWLQPISTFGRLRIENSFAKIWGINLDQVPLSLQLMTGGANSVRGYRYNSIGPGLALKTFSVEWQQAIRENWYGLLFVDGGSAGEKLSARIERGVGLGGMWHSAIGDVELTYARALDLPSRPWRLQFSINRVIGRSVA